MSNWKQVHCPNCKHQDHLHVVHMGTCLLTFDGSEDCGDHEYDDDSHVDCRSCGWEGKVGELVQDTYFSTSSGTIEIMIDLDDAYMGSHPGDCEPGVRTLIELPYIAEQLARYSDDHIRDELKEWGAWDDEELADDEMNLVRLVWIACGEIREEAANKEDEA